jgi:hypothetical protein
MRGQNFTESIGAKMGVKKLKTPYSGGIIPDYEIITTIHD